ncbi:hypothetical protein GWK53_01295 [Burkholderia cepacia]|uniref:hypothetical protein n=1 Tax=Burkholderia cepacia TaxID=292 RepID=UPI0013F3B388|nr:hypothetical protein [Burkholderia cepacia]NHB05144.1 hypothetical protein [Burkholderia cepacia]
MSRFLFSIPDKKPIAKEVNARIPVDGAVPVVRHACRQADRADPGPTARGACTTRQT